MKILAVGLNHKSAPIDIREKLYFSNEQIKQALSELKIRFNNTEFVLLSTCNRVELYCAGQRASQITPEQIEKFLSDFHQIDINEFRELIYIYTDEDAARHLLTVACGLDSMVLGEDQILGQVKESYKFACEAKSTGKILNRLFHCAFFTSKKVHTSTGISDGRISIAGVAVEMAKKLISDMQKSKTLVIGAGEMGELLVKHLLHAGCKDINVINRSYDRAKTIAQRRQIKAIEWSELNKHLLEADIVISSISTKDYCFNKDFFEKIMHKRGENPVLIVDISVPRNFEPAIGKLENVHLYSIDELSGVAKQNLKAREEDITKGMQIISENVSEFMEWFGIREIGPLIGQMKNQFGQISQNELERFFIGYRQEAPCKEVLETMVNRIVNKLLHCVISNVETTAKNDSPTEAARMVNNIVKQAVKISSEDDAKSDE